MSRFSDYGPSLVKLGHQILPIAPGEKYPKGVPNWQNSDNKQGTLSKWNKRFPRAGVGIRCDKTPAIDIDVYDKDVSEKLMGWLKERLDGPVIERVGEAPKVLVPVRTTRPWKKKLSREYQDVFGLSNKIEILGVGQFFVAYHVHPDTDKDYFFTSEKTLTDVDRKELPLLTEDLLAEFFDFYDSVVPDPWVLKGQAQTGTSDNDGALSGLAPKQDLTESQIEKLLTQLPNDELAYDTYIQVGMGLHHQFDGAQKGFDLWQQWGEKASKNSYQTNALKWKSFGRNRGAAPVTMATVLRIASEHEVKLQQEKDLGDLPVPQEADSVKGFLKRYAYVPEENRVLDLKRPLQYALIPINSFKNLTANCRTEIPAPTKAEPEKMKDVPIWQLWLTNRKRMTVEGTTYTPDSDKRIVRAEDNRLLVNMAHFPDHQKVSEKLDPDSDLWRLDIFNRHMEYLFPDANQRQWFIQWLAFNIQKPGQRCKVTPLHVSQPHGTGRGWVVNLIEELLGKWNVSKTKISEMCGEGSAGQYQDYLHEKLVCCVEEVKATDKRYSVSDAIRDKLTENRLNVNLKYGGKATIDVFVNFFWMSNHADAMILPQQDRRIHVLQGPDHVQPREYYDELYAWLGSKENMAFLWRSLKEMDLTSFEWQVAPVTKAREKMLVYTLTSTEDMFNTWLQENENEWLLFEDVRYAVNLIAERDGETAPMVDAQLKKLLQKACYQGAQMRLGDGRRGRPWYLGTETEPNHSLDYIRKQLEKARAT